jgi:hypothetical protein
MTIEFQEFPKIPRYRREVAITEKIDGTNAAVVWFPVPQTGSPEEFSADTSLPENAIAVRMLVDQHGVPIGPHYLLAQSRQRFITPARVKPKNDNYGFAQWVDSNVDELTKLGPGVHYGEWWGYGIQRGYGVPEKRFSLFNVNRWNNESRPVCCHVVPLLGYFGPDQITAQVERLRSEGSIAAPGYMRPEGVIVWHSQSKQYYKILLENDEVPKSLVK